MSDLISRQAAIDAIKRYESADSYDLNNGLFIAMNAVTDVQTIDPAENGGCWGCQCALCGQYQGKSIPGEVPTIATVSTDDHVYRAGYTQAIKDIIEYMDNSGVLEVYVDPYEIGGFMQCLKNVGDTLIKEISD